MTFDKIDSLKHDIIFKLRGISKDFIERRINDIVKTFHRCQDLYLDINNQMGEFINLLEEMKKYADFSSHIDSFKWSLGRFLVALEDGLPTP